MDNKYTKVLDSAELLVAYAKLAEVSIGDASFRVSQWIEGYSMDALKLLAQNAWRYDDGPCYQIIVSVAVQKFLKEGFGL